MDEVTLRAIRQIFGALEARVQLSPRWHGAELERLLDEDHAMLVAAVARRLEALGWSVVLEVTYSEFGERGSIDVLGLRPNVRAAAVLEVKTDVASAEAIGRKLDEKARLAPAIVRARFNWTPVTVGRIVVMPDTMRLRRIVHQHEVIALMFPVSAVDVRRWLRNRRGPFAGLWFLSNVRGQVNRGVSPSHQRRIRPISPSPGACDQNRLPSIRANFGEGKHT